MRKVDIIILSVCAILVATSLLTLLLWLNQAEGSPAMELDYLDIARDPLQEDSIQEALPVLKFGKYKLIMSSKAKYTIDGKLVSKKRYSHGVMNRLAPYDFALAWGDLPQYLDQIKFKQTSRFCLFFLKKDATVAVKYVEEHMSNNHLIPASKNIKKAMRKARKRDSIRIEGHLVNVQVSSNGRVISSWNSSVSREDTGNGACELIYVTRLRIDDIVYE